MAVDRTMIKVTKESAEIIKKLAKKKGQTMVMYVDKWAEKEGSKEGIIDQDGNIKAD